MSSNDKKITDEQLEEEIRKGRTQKEIAYDHGFGYPSATLSHRAEKLGYKKNRVSKIRSDGGVNVYINKSFVSEMLDKADESLVDKNGDDALAYEFVRVSNDGCLILKPHSRPWRTIK